MFHKRTESKMWENTIIHDLYASRIVNADFSAEELVEPTGKFAILFRMFGSHNCDAFFLPQRVLVSFFAAIFVLLMMFVQIWTLFEKVEGTVRNAANVPLQTLLAGLSTFVSLYHEKAGGELFDDDAGLIHSMLDNADCMYEMMQTFGSRFYLSYAIGFAVATLVFLYSWIQLIFAFRSKVLQARRGVWSFDPDKVKLADAANFTGISISNGLMSFIYFVFIFTILVFVLIWEVTVSTPLIDTSTNMVHISPVDNHYLSIQPCITTIYLFNHIFVHRAQTLKPILCNDADIQTHARVLVVLAVSNIVVSDQEILVLLGPNCCYFRRQLHLQKTFRLQRDYQASNVERVETSGRWRLLAPAWLLPSLRSVDVDRDARYRSDDRCRAFLDHSRHRARHSNTGGRVASPRMD